MLLLRWCCWCADADALMLLMHWCYWTIVIVHCLTVSLSTNLKDPSPKRKKLPPKWSAAAGAGTWRVRTLQARGSWTSLQCHRGGSWPGACVAQAAHQSPCSFTKIIRLYDVDTSPPWPGHLPTPLITHSKDTSQSTGDSFKRFEVIRMEESSCFKHNIEVRVQGSPQPPSLKSLA